MQDGPAYRCFGTKPSRSEWEFNSLILTLPQAVFLSVFEIYCSRDEWKYNSFGSGTAICGRLERIRPTRRDLFRNCKSGEGWHFVVRRATVVKPKPGSEGETGHFTATYSTAYRTWCSKRIVKIHTLDNTVCNTISLMCYIFHYSIEMIYWNIIVPNVRNG